MQLTIKNRSMLSQKIAFSKLKREIDIQPSDGFAVLIPNESITFNLSLRPSAAIAYDMSILLTTSLNENYHIQLVAAGIESPVSFSHSVLHMRSTCPGERVIGSVLIKNTSSSQQALELVTPDPRFTWVKCSPSVLCLEPGVSSRIEVEFYPPVNLVDQVPQEWHDNALQECKKSPLELYTQESPFVEWNEDDSWVYGDGAFGGVQWSKPSGNADVSSFPEIEDGQLTLNGDEWGIIGNWHFPVAVKSKRNHSHSSKSSSSFMYLGIQTSVKLPEFVADSNFLDFGQMAVGTRTIKRIKVKNTSQDRTMYFSASPLNIGGPFWILNASRDILPSQSIVIVIDCKPERSGLVSETLEFSSKDGGQRITVTLKVHGINPIVRLSGLEAPPLNWNSPLGGILDFGNVVILDECSKSFKILNESSFPVETFIQRAICEGVYPTKQAESVQRTSAGLPMFSFEPENAIIPQASSIDVKIIFRPDRSRLYPFREDFNILVGKGGDDKIKFSVCGISRKRQIYVKSVRPIDEEFYKNGMLADFNEDLVAGSNSLQVREISKSVFQSLGVTNSNSSEETITLEFPDPYKEGFQNVEPPQIQTATKGKDVKEDLSKKTNGIVQSRQISVCCANILNSRIGTGGGTFDFVFSKNAIDSSLFSVSVDKGPVTAGNDVVLSFSCTLPKPKGLGGLEVGSWQKYPCVLNLRGGWKPDGDASDAAINIVLAAYVRL